MTRTTSICLLLLWFFQLSVSAQPSDRLKFAVVHLPRITGYSKQKLNEEMTTATSRDTVRKIIRSKNFPKAEIVISISEPGKPRVWWTISSNGKNEKESEDIILQSRDNTVLKIARLNDFRTILKDTLLLFDTLRVELALNDESYPDDQFMIGWTCKGKKKFEQKIPLESGRLLFTASMFAGCEDRYYPVKLFSAANTGRVLAEALLCFSDAQQQETLLNVADYYRQLHADWSLKEVAVATAGYCSIHFGKPCFPQLVSWLEKNLPGH